MQGQAVESAGLESEIRAELGGPALGAPERERSGRPEGPALRLKGIDVQPEFGGIGKRREILHERRTGRNPGIDIGPALPFRPSPASAVKARLRLPKTPAEFVHRLSGPGKRRRVEDEEVALAAPANRFGHGIRTDAGPRIRAQDRSHGDVVQSAQSHLSFVIEAAKRVFAPAQDAEALGHGTGPRTGVLLDIKKRPGGKDGPQEGLVARPKLERFEDQKDVGKEHVSPKHLVLEAEELRRQGGPRGGDARPQVILIKNGGPPLLFSERGRPGFAHDPGPLVQAVERPFDPAPFGFLVGEIRPQTQGPVAPDRRIVSDDIIRGDVDLDPGPAPEAELVFDHLVDKAEEPLEGHVRIAAQGERFGRGRLDAKGQGQVGVFQKLAPDRRVFQQGQVGDQRDQMPLALQQVEILMDPLVEQGLAQDIEQDRRPQVQGVELVQKSPHPGVVLVSFPAAQNVRRTEGAMHVAMAGQFDENGPRGGRGIRHVRTPRRL